MSVGTEWFCKTPINIGMRLINSNKFNYSEIIIIIIRKIYYCLAQFVNFKLYKFYIGHIMIVLRLCVVPF